MTFCLFDILSFHVLSFCHFSFCIFVFLWFCLFLSFCFFAFLSFYHSDQMSGGSQVSKVTLCVQKFLRRSRVGIELRGQLKSKKELEQVALVAAMLVVAAMLEH